MQSLSKINIAVNTYIGNYCWRKCFMHEDIMKDCFKKFDLLKYKLKFTLISLKEFNFMMREDHISICKLLKELRYYISWKKFEKLRNIDKDYWDMYVKNENR